MKISGIEIDPANLLSKDNLFAILREGGESDRALEPVRERYDTEFGNELIWRYPISNGYHMGVFIVPIQEGFISLPYNVIDEEQYELLELDDASMFDAEAMQFFIDEWSSYSEALIGAMSDMQRILRGE